MVLSIYCLLLYFTTDSRTRHKVDSSIFRSIYAGCHRLAWPKPVRGLKHLHFLSQMRQDWSAKTFSVTTTVIYTHSWMQLLETWTIDHLVVLNGSKKIRKWLLMKLLNCRLHWCLALQSFILELKLSRRVNLRIMSMGHYIFSIQLLEARRVTEHDQTQITDLISQKISRLLCIQHCHKYQGWLNQKVKSKRNLSEAR